jgi:hypothetical protein
MKWIGWSVHEFMRRFFNDTDVIDKTASSLCMRVLYTSLVFPCIFQRTKQKQAASPKLRGLVQKHPTFKLTGKRAQAHRLRKYRTKWWGINEKQQDFINKMASRR